MDMKNATLGQLQYLSQQHTEYRKQAVIEILDRLIELGVPADDYRGKRINDRVAGHYRVQQGILFKDEG